MNKNLTISEWMNALVSKLNINFSEILQNTLLGKITL